VTTLLQTVATAVGAATKMVVRGAAIGLLVAARWDDDDPVAYDPLLTR
jgi:hypothetical protein